ncbi:hypothetical protein PGT21_012007 [Puccinia graminis f. sp. tritici]|uniref:Uncharacterized protein n=1 Tax=Puccinia graminis f. sp. tritici TaxID=56615 RepID=A0A5B0N716_PUCGR|nr:hypothetical protein PGT21_012007 [Puccinia graminis f. sp. tritici]
MPMKDETSSSDITRSLSLPAVVCLILGPGSQIVYERPTALSKYKMPYAPLGPFLLIGHYSDISLGLKSGPNTRVITVWRIIEVSLTPPGILIKLQRVSQPHQIGEIRPLRSDCAHGVYLLEHLGKDLLSGIKRVLAMVRGNPSQ